MSSPQNQNSNRPGQNNKSLFLTIFVLIAIFIITTISILSYKNYNREDKKITNTDATSNSQISEIKKENSSSSTKMIGKFVNFANANSFGYAEYIEKEALFNDENGQPIKCGIDGVDMYSISEKEVSPSTANAFTVSRQLAIGGGASESLNSIEKILDGNWYNQYFPLTKSKFFELTNLDSKINPSGAFRTADCTGEFLDAPVKFLEVKQLPNSDKSKTFLSIGGHGEKVSLEIQVYARKNDKYIRIVKIISNTDAFPKEQQNKCDKLEENEAEKCYSKFAYEDQNLNKKLTEEASNLLDLFAIK